MQPLKSRETATSPIEAAAITLLRSAEPYQPPAGLKQRVRMRLLTTRNRTLPKLHALRPALIVGCILIAVGASAAIGGKWFLNYRNAEQHLSGNQRTKASPARLQYAQRSAPASPLAMAAPVASVNPPSAPVDSARLSVAAQSATPSANGTGAATHAELTPANHPSAIARATPSSEKELVFDAMRALRREGQPERAARLLDEYMRRYPRGSLAEEALALAIEANTALGDPRVKSLADRYLASYPEGRFRSAALRARARFSQ